MAEPNELAAEQAHVDRAYAALEATRDKALALKGMVEVGKGGTNQARWEREVFYENIANRLRDLDIGTRSICFGRIDNQDGDSLYMGRLGVSDIDQTVLLVDWRAPAAEPFYRATGRDSRGLVRRRHFTSRERKLLGIEDEFFGDAAGTLSTTLDGRELRGQGALMAALEQNRTGKLGDIVGTIQGEQDEIIRSPMAGVLVVQGGPGTGKTVVALHRAAFLIYEHRFPLEDQGVLVVGPNKVFLSYIEQVLPSLGEAGIELSTLADLVQGVRVQGRDEAAARRVKGDPRMVDVIRRAVRDRQRTIPADQVINIGARKVVLPKEAVDGIISEARRRYRDHNAARKYVEAQIFEVLSERHPDKKSPAQIAELVRRTDQMRELFMRVWPVLTPAQLLHDLFGSLPLISSACGSLLSADEAELLHRPWQDRKDAHAVVWTVDDVSLLDEAWERLGPVPKKAQSDYVRTYGHIVVDEIQDVSPMQLRMLCRRSLSGSMTVVGDLGQSSGVWAYDNWDQILSQLPDRRPSRYVELTIGYRIPEKLMEPAVKVLGVAAPQLKAPTSVRAGGRDPEVIVAKEQSLERTVYDIAISSSRDNSGNTAVICPVSLVDSVVYEFESRGSDVGRGIVDGLAHQVTVISAHMVKGLEVNTAIVVEPAKIVDEEHLGERALYVALTRATESLVIVHEDELPSCLNSR